VYDRRRATGAWKKKQEMMKNETIEKSHLMNKEKEM